MFSSFRWRAASIAPGARGALPPCLGSRPEHPAIRYGRSAHRARQTRSSVAEPGREGLAKPAARPARWVARYSLPHRLARCFAALRAPWRRARSQGLGKPRIAPKRQSEELHPLLHRGISQPCTALHARSTLLAYPRQRALLRYPNASWDGAGRPPVQAFAASTGVRLADLAQGAEMGDDAARQSR